MLTYLDPHYDDDLPDCKISILQQLKEGKGMIRSALHVGLAVGSVVGVFAIGVATVVESIQRKAGRD